MMQLDKDFVINNFATQFKKIAIIIISTLLVGLFLSKSIITTLKDFAPFSVHLIQTSPTEGVFTALKAAICFCIYTSSPFILYRLFKQENSNWFQYTKKKLISIISIAFALSLIGTALSIYCIIPLLLMFLLGFNVGEADIAINLSNYISFCLSVIFKTVLIFETPILIKLSSYLNFEKINNYKLNKKNYMLAALATSFLIITPTSAIEILLLTGTIITIYKLSILISKEFSKKGEK